MAEDAPYYTPSQCSQCHATETVAWRIDKEAEAILCNKCYVHKYPRTSDGGDDEKTIAGTKDIASVEACTRPDSDASMDPEYGQVDVDGAAAVIAVDRSGFELLDGIYDRMPRDYQGRPAYCKRETENRMFVYYVHGMWRIGPQCGSDSCMARVAAVPGGPTDCLEPYPLCWNVTNGKKRRKFDEVPGFRVFDYRNRMHWPKLPKALMEDTSSSCSTSSGCMVQGGTDRARRKKAKTEETKRPESGARSKEKETVVDPGSSSSTTSSTTSSDEVVDDEEDAVVKKEVDTKKADGEKEYDIEDFWKEDVKLSHRAPSTPHQNEPLHRTALLPKPIWRTRSEHARLKNFDGSDVTSVFTCTKIPPFELVPITSYRNAGETLWYPSPGSTVMCDACERRVPQASGALLGAPGRSQFAQCEFRCMECMSAYT